MRDFFKKLFSFTTSTNGKQQKSTESPMNGASCEDIKVTPTKPAPRLGRNGLCGFDICGFYCGCCEDRC